MIKTTTTVLSLLALATLQTQACPASDSEIAHSSDYSDAQAGIYTEIRSPGKATAPVDVQYRLNSKPAIGVALQLEIEFRTQASPELDVEYKAPATLVAGNTDGARRLASGETMTIDLLPSQAGRFYVTVIARPVDDGRGAARVVSIPVQVGKPQARVSKAVASADGELLIRLPAEQ